METETHPKKSRNPFSMQKAHKNTSNLSQILTRKTNLIQWTTHLNYKLRATAAKFSLQSRKSPLEIQRSYLYVRISSPH